MVAGFAELREIFAHENISVMIQTVYISVICFFDYITTETDFLALEKTTTGIQEPTLSIDR